MDKLPIAPRQEGETEEVYQRRYNREKMRIYRARKPKSDRKRGKGKGPAKNGTLTQAEWEALQPLPGETPEETRRRYNREAMRRSRASNPDRHKEVRLAYYEANKEHIRAVAKAWRENNPEKAAEHQRRYFEAHREERLAALADWGEENPERLREARARWRDENRALCASYAGRWRRQARLATPEWADAEQILAIYLEAQRLSAETGSPHHVDHIVPLTNDLVCGLHTQANLRVVLGVENMRKRNKIDYTLIYSLYGANPEGHIDDEPTPEP